jgi:transcriptional regulator with XRE-family HTH domain
MLGEFVRAARRARGWTQRELAARAGRSRGYVAHIERGATPVPRRATLRRLAGALGLRAAQLALAAGLLDRLLEGDPQLQALVGALVADGALMAQLGALGQDDGAVRAEVAELARLHLGGVLRERAARAGGDGR